MRTEMGNNGSQLIALQRPVEQKVRRKGGRRGKELKSLTPCLGSSEKEHIHALSGGPLGQEEMSVCALIQSAMPLLMMASTCCFNVTAGSPSIPHWLWLPSAAGSSPPHPPPSISAAISASPASLRYHLVFLLSILPPVINFLFYFSHKSVSTVFPLLHPSF